MMPARIGRTLAAAASAVTGATPKPAMPRFGAGYLYHYDADYGRFAARLAEVGGVVDIYEILGIQFNSEPSSLARFARALGKPITLHSFEYFLGNIDPPPQSVIDRIQAHARAANVAYIGEHIGIMGADGDYVGGFLQPPGTDEQTEILVRNLVAAQAGSAVPIIVENPSQFYGQMGPRSIGRQMREVAEAADVGLLLSLSNISISERFRPQDRDEFLAEIPLERVREIHVLCGNTQEEQSPGMERTRFEHEWAFALLGELAKRPELRPNSVIFELETGTPSLPEPEKLRDYMVRARELFFAETEARQAA
jgi:uncharacterized protein (UPF0276 family)